MTTDQEKVRNEVEAALETFNDGYAEWITFNYDEKGFIAQFINIDGDIDRTLRFKLDFS